MPLKDSDILFCSLSHSFKSGTLDRWKKGMCPLKIQDQEYGRTVIRMLEKYEGNEFAFFDDPFEAVTFILLVELMKERDKKEVLGF
jgi:hypothetical protein